MKAKTIYTITFEGEYRAETPHGQSVKQFTIDVKMLPEHVAYNPLSVFMKTLAPNVMPLKYPDFLSVRKARVANSVAVTPAGERRSALQTGNINLMNRKELTIYAEQEDIPMEMNLYQTNGEIIAAINLFRRDAEGFTKQQDQLRAKRANSTAELMELAKQLNNPTQEQQTQTEPGQPAVEQPAAEQPTAEPEPQLTKRPPGRPPKRLEDLNGV